MLSDIRKGLKEAYKHKLIDGGKCVICGCEKVPIALHVIEFHHEDKISTPSYFVPMSQNRGRFRGSVPICDRCCPPCGKCSLPIATKWIDKVRGELNLQHTGFSFSIGLGICKHIHVVSDMKALFKSAKLSGIDVPNYESQKKSQNNLPTKRREISSIDRQKDHELGIKIVHDDVLKQGYSIASINPDITKQPQIVAKKVDRFSFLWLRLTVWMYRRFQPAVRRHICRMRNSTMQK